MGGTDVHFCPLLGRDAGQPGVFDDAAVEKLHDVEGRADHAVVFAEAVGFWDRHVCLFQSVDDSVLPLDFMRRLREELAWRLLAHDEFVAIVVGELVGGIGLAEAELLRAVCQ